MFFNDIKFQQRVAELGARRYFGNQSIAPFTAMSGTLTEDEVYHELPEKIEGSTFGINDVFSGRDAYMWLEKAVTIPEAMEGCSTVGYFDFGENTSNATRGVEGLLYVDGKCWQGIDINHREVILDGLEGRQVRLTFLLWTGLEGGGVRMNFHHWMKQACLRYLHKKTDQLYYLMKAAAESLTVMSSEDEAYEKLITVLERTLQCIDWDEDRFFTTAEQAYDVLDQGLKRIGKNTDVTVHAVGHTHIDLAYLWRLKHTAEKAQRSFSTVLRLMEQYEDYRFLQSQPQIYQYVKDYNPELFERIREKIRSGQWEPDGGMWVEADCNIPSGESLVRQFLHGTRFMEREFGKKCEFLWLPDVFGYSWALPQILKQCEIDTFMTTKISWSQYNAFPCDLFRWKGMDGTEILTYFISTPEPWQRDNMNGATYNGMLTPFTVKGCWKKFKNKELTRDVMLAYGYGDGGGGPTRDMLEMRRAIDRIPGMPHVRTSTAGEFFRKLHEQADNSERYIHTWDGEMYLEYHRGTYTSQADTKRYNRKLENRLRRLEWLSSLRYLKDGVYPEEELHESWECVLRHQFHDIIPGSSIHEVYEDAAKSYQAVEELLDRVEQSLLPELVTEEANVYGIYSSNSFGGTELVHIPEVQSGSFRDGKGDLLEADRSGEGYDVLVQTVPFGVRNITFCPGEKVEEEKSFTIGKNTLETPFYSMEWDWTGALVRLYDKQAGRSVLKNGQKGNVLEVYEDKPMKYDAWDIDIFYIQKMETMELAGAAELLEENSLKAVLRFTYRYRHSTVVSDMTVYKNNRRIDFVTTVDWKERHRLLKAAFYTDIRSTAATYDSQFGHLSRPTHWNNSWDWARFEVCGHKWADISEDGYGVSLLNDCKYGYNAKDGALKLSLLKGAEYPDPEADLGVHTFTYSLYPHTGSVTEGGTIEAANRLNLPAQVVKGNFADTGRLFWLEGKGVQIDAVKKAVDEDCLIIRLHECLGGKRRVKLYTDYPVKEMIPCNLLEHDCGEAITENGAELEFGAFEIKSFKVRYDKDSI